MTATSIYNALDYGATGNGSTDDTTAIQNTINASVGSSGSPTLGAPPAIGGGVCYVGPGVYRISATLTIPQGCHLIVDGTLALVDNAIQCPVLLSIVGSHVLIGGSGTLDGNYDGQTLPSLIKSQAGIATPSGTGYSSIIVTGLTIQNFTSYGVNMVGASDVRLDRLTITNCHVANEFADGCTNCHASRLTISGIPDYGFAFYNGVTDCSISDSYLHDNHVNIGILTDGAYGSNPAPLPSSGVRIVGNHCFRATTNPGIVVRAATCPPVTGPTASSGCYPITHSNIAILNNHVYSNGDGKVRGGGGIQVTTTATCTISGNTCSGDLGDEIVIGDDGPTASSYWPCSNVTVSNNKCYGARVAGNGVAIRIPWNAPEPLHSTITIKNNVTNGNAGNGIFVSGVSDCSVFGNHCAGDSGAGIAVGTLVTQLHKHDNTVDGVTHDTADSSASDVWTPQGASRLADAHNLMWSTTGQMNYGVQGGPNNNVMMHGLWIGGWTIAPTNYDISGLNVQQTDNGIPIVGGPTTIGTAARAPEVGAYAFGTALTVPAASKVLAPPWASVQDFGAIGDGVTDDTGAIEAALGYAQAKGVPLYLPAGTYRLTATLPPITAAGLRIFGDGPALSVLLQGAAAATQGLTLNAPHLTVEGLGFTGMAGTTQWSGVVCQSGAPFPTIRECNFQTYASATVVGGAIVFANTTGGLIVYAHIRGCRFFGPAGGVASAIYIDNGYDDLVIEGCGFGLAGGGSLAPSGGVAAGSSGGVAGATITGCLFCEDSTPICIQAQNSWAVVGCIFESVQIAVAVAATTFFRGMVVIAGNTFSLWDVNLTGSPCVDAQALPAGAPLAVTGNAFNGAQGAGSGPAILCQGTTGTLAAVVGNTFIGPGIPSAADLSGAAVVADNAGLGVGWSTTPPAIETELVVTSLEDLVDFTPAQPGLYQIDVYLRVAVAATTVTLQVTYTDAEGAQTTLLLNGVYAAPGSYHVPALVLGSVAGQPITVQAQASTANQVFVSASIQEA